MTKTKNVLLLWLVTAIAMVWCTRWAKVTLQPLFSDVRFQPSDQLHAGCTNSADIFFSPQGQKITKFTIILSYNPETLEILRVLPTIDGINANSKIEYDKIILEVNNPTFSSSTESKSFFKIYFKSAIAGKDTISIATWSAAFTSKTSYPLAGNFDITFAKVPECEPDVIPPSINLIYPKDSNAPIYLDQYFIFDIKDIGKWIDKNSVVVNFDGDQYFYGSANMKRNGNYLTFYPSKWIPIHTGLDLKIIISDKQSYGWSNTAQSTYTFHSATGMLLHKNISPIVYRQIAQEADKISASVDECQLLSNLYTTSDLAYQVQLTTILQKLWCNLASVGSLEEPENDDEIDTIRNRQYTHISVFGTLWWILFFITFTLKMHYIAAYKKHKKTSSAQR